MVTHFFYYQLVLLGLLWLFFPHSTRFSGRVCHCSLKASRREDLHIEQPVARRDLSAFHVHATLTCMQSPTLIRHQVLQVRQLREKRLLAATRMMEPLHRE